MVTTTFYYIVETEKGNFKYIDFKITHGPFTSSEDYTKTHEEIGPLFLERQLKVAIEKIKPITREQYEMRHDE